MNEKTISLIAIILVLLGEVLCMMVAQSVVMWGSWVVVAWAAVLVILAMYGKVRGYHFWNVVQSGYQSVGMSADEEGEQEYDSAGEPAVAGVGEYYG